MFSIYNVFVPWFLPEFVICFQNIYEPKIINIEIIFNTFPNVVLRSETSFYKESKWREIEIKPYIETQ